ncbi:4'-phosphopantetheinyl transferase family protein [Variovorax saccharolyticus]|uniref:4'-phosphopantetheinyl transferase family protein n=1 Tax=Variovorax saccharolyticus TaxID=3053516 RepID=UPI0025764A19|nr:MULTISPECIES: 4'-phosphopantetheinyl transferase superfamily protein [unclassified Variovorax]MDM0017771.1 4'-phosphopantetheinyl transferase superfamily protein [Variovorax sp. J22R187]MDM0024743.1 4'-phosphopantetheinyl transferase superfamily protein [Variovorax sp. J31P216]
MSITPVSWPGPSQLWQVELDAAPAPGAAACLSEAEWARARRFAFTRDRDRFIAAHAALRQVLAAQSGTHPALLEFDEGAFGKPALGGEAGPHFNLSHSQSLALIAVDAQCAVGIDIELPRAIPDLRALAATCFTPNEVCALDALPSGRRERAFFNGWTRKEACVKALGLGLSADLQRLEVGLDEVDRSVSYAGADGCEHTLRVLSVPLAGGAIGALAIQTSCVRRRVSQPRRATLETLQ